LTAAEFGDLLKELHAKASDAVKEAVAAQDIAACSIKSNHLLNNQTIILYYFISFRAC
jgi:hypothetical protein